MGVTFRTGTYLKHVICGGRTIKDGEAAAIWNRNGVHEQIIGPKRVFLFSSTIRFLDRYRAESHEYLRVAYLDGRVEHIHGPASIYMNVAYHSSISVHSGIQLKTCKECILVQSNPVVKDDSTYSMEGYTTIEGSHDSSMDEIGELKNADVKEISNTTKGQMNDGDMRIIYGPFLYIPKPTEQIHSFLWPTLDKKQFHILSTSDQSWKNIKLSISTSDGYSFTVSLIIDYSIISISKIVSCLDPIAAMYNALQADSQRLGETFSGDMLRSAKHQKGIIDTLTTLQTFPNLCVTTERSGIDVKSIYITELTLCDTLSRQLDQEQQLSANVRSELAEKSQRRQIHELEIQDERKRIEEESKLKSMASSINDQLEQELHAQKVAAFDRNAELRKQEMEAEVSLLKVKDDQMLNVLERMKDLNIDLTKVMIAYPTLVKTLIRSLLDGSEGNQFFPGTEEKKDGNKNLGDKRQTSELKQDAK